MSDIYTAARSLLKAWDDSISYEPCADCLRSGGGLLTFKSEAAIDFAADTLRDALSNAPMEGEK